jgi:septum formation protein
VSGAARAPLLLASGSPRRAALLTAAGVDFERGAAPAVDETPPAGVAPEDVPVELAVRKALVAARAAPGRTVLAADTVVVHDDRVLGKPADDADARRMLARLSGRRHRVVTAVAVARDGLLAYGKEAATVTFRPLSEAEIDAYVRTGEPLDKAGAYAIQGGAAGFVSSREGSFDTVVGLPVALALSLAARLDRTLDVAAGGADGRKGGGLPT